MKTSIHTFWLLCLSSVAAFNPQTSFFHRSQYGNNLRPYTHACIVNKAKLNTKWSLASTPSDEMPEPLAQEGDWGAYKDDGNSGMVYYFNFKTGESLWEPPTSTFPDVNKKKKTSFFDGFNDKSKTSSQEVVIAEGGPEPLAEEGDWAAYLDSEDTGMVYYFNLKTGENLWDPPTKTFPTINVGKKAETSVFDMFSGVSKSTAKVEVEEIMEEEEEEEEVEEVPVEKKPIFPAFTNPFQSNANEVTPLDIEASLKILPHPAKVSWGGEDAAFVQGRSFGVFDGVSGADKVDGIPLYSVTLSDQMRQMVREQSELAFDENDEKIPGRKESLNMDQMQKLLNRAANYADAYATGASTAIVGSLGDDNFLRILNLGDCACIIIRDSKVAARSRDIVHYFDCPFQLSVDSPDRPKDGTRLTIEVLPGDRILMASDGVFDNLDEDSIIEAMDRFPQKASMMAKSVINASRKVSIDRNAVTPYATEEQKNDPDAPGLGGKLDDISCVVLLLS